MSLRSLFERLHSSGSPAYQDLVQLKETLDGECWQVSEATASSFRSEDYTTDLIKRIAVYLSGPLNQVEDSESSRYRILQLRTLVAALALLHHLGVKELHAEPYSTLRLNIADRFSDIAHGRRRSQSLAVEKHRWVEAHFLVMLAEQYFSLFKRSLPRAEALLQPVLGLMLTGASMASGQYNNLRNVFMYMDQIIAEIPSPQRRKITLPGLQEITRNSISVIQNYSSENKQDVLLEASSLLREALETRLNDTPVFSKTRWDWARAILHRTPHMDEGFVRLGLLDCAIQLSSQSGPDTLPSELQQTVQRLAFEDEDWDIRWASIEFFLSFGPSRQRQHSRIQNEASLYPPSVTARIVDTLEVVYEALETDEPSLGRREGSASSSSEVSHSTPDSSTSITRRSTLSNDINSNEEPPIEPPIPPRISRTFELPIGKSYTNAGISEDCRLLYYYNHKRIIVYSTLTALGSNTKAARHPLKDVFNYSEPAHTIHKVALSRTWMVVCTNQDLAVFQVRNHTIDKATAVRRPCTGWGPRGLAIHESEDSLKIVIGQCRQGRISVEGQILLFTVRQKGNGHPSICEPLVYKLDGDHPKDVDFSPNGTLFLCRTELRNNVLVWELPSDSSANERSISISKSSYTQETGIQGVTSISTYTSQIGKQYLLCTTAASSERCRNEGEWPYCSPITFPPGHVAGASVHNLESFTKKPTLVSGAVSSVLNVFAVLEKNGKISFIGLQAHPQGGIYDGDQEPETVEFSLNKQGPEIQICPSVLRFDESGTRLYAVGPDGKIVIVDFVDRNDLPIEPPPATIGSRKSSFSPRKLFSSNRLK